MILSVLRKKQQIILYVFCIKIFFFSKNSLMSDLDILVGIFLKSNNKISDDNFFCSVNLKSSSTCFLSDEL
jgi:hypothetical protein